MPSYRYTLTREGWAGGAGRLCWVMLNPSTADEQVDDPTIRRVTGFTKAWGFESLVVVNLFAIRSTDPKQLRELGRDHDIVGPHNRDAIRNALDGAMGLIVAWGAQPIAREYGMPRFVELQAKLVDLRPACLGTTKDGSPLHPLYVKATQPVQPWSSTEVA